MTAKKPPRLPLPSSATSKEAPSPDARERSIPDYLEGKEDWTHGDFVLDALSRGYSKAQAERFALQYLWRLGKREYPPPAVDGFTVVSDRPLFKDGGQVAFLFRTARGRRRYQFFTDAGRRVGPSHDALAGAVAWQMKFGWVSI